MQLTRFPLLLWQCHLPSKQPSVITKRGPGRCALLRENLQRCCCATHQEVNGWGDGSDVDQTTGERLFFLTRVVGTGLSVPTLV